jgi:hypothetical protein
MVVYLVLILNPNLLLVYFLLDMHNKIRIHQIVYLALKIMMNKTSKKKVFKDRFNKKVLL